MSFNFIIISIKKKLIKSSTRIESNTSQRMFNNRENYNMKSWVLEGSIDDEHWIILDERNDVESLKDSDAVQTFSIQNWQNIEFNYIRLRQTSYNWKNCQNLAINSIEFFGSLIEENGY